ncbi:MAG: hypothetical protein R3320_04915 [Nitriliruptorales bacterium]|nr:hypothetical protein [Nitriliruptorales bacterium]
MFALHRYEDDMPTGWRPPVVIPYGSDESQLGTSLGGDGEGIQWGPDYGVVAPDGTWWILDSAKRRFAHYGAAGDYLGQVTIPSEHLVDGRFAQWQHPLALADGTIVTFRMSGDRTILLLLREGTFGEVGLDRQVAVKADDGELLYGFGADGELLAVDPTNGTIAEVGAFRSRTGEHYRLARDGSDLVFELPDRNVSRIWPQVTPETGAPAAGAISLATTTDGRFHVLIDGAAEDEEQTGRAGYGVIDLQGSLTSTEPTRDPWSPSDGGTGSRLVARPGAVELWFITVDGDAVRLYQRVWS